jgi:hypothetical protein
MNWDAVAAIAETAGALLVVATLVYVSIQIRQNTENARAATELEVSRRFSEVSKRILDDAELQRIWDAVATGEKLSPEEYRHYLWLVDWFFPWQVGSSFNIVRACSRTIAGKSGREACGACSSRHPFKNGGAMKTHPYCTSFVASSTNL